MGEIQGMVEGWVGFHVLFSTLPSPNLHVFTNLEAL